jgi:predicted TPR repeat methyltransferase
MEIPPSNHAPRLRERLLLAPQDIEAMKELALLLEKSGDLPGAIDLYQRALRVDPYEMTVLASLGRLWAELGDAVRARSWWERAVSIDPDCREAITGLAALNENADLSPAYIRTLFDQYADRFDRELLHVLKYRAPALVASALERQGVAAQSADILDLGCGTGLSGLALKPFARRLDGVDLSPGMIAKARARAIYDSLAVAEAGAYLGESAERWNIAAAVDVLNYLPDLGPMFRAVAARLRPAGLLVGTVEKRPEGGAALTVKRRYAHGADHVREAILAAGMTLMEMSEDRLRNEGGAAVTGIIFAARSGV